MAAALLLLCALASAQIVLTPESELEQAQQRLLADGDIGAARRRFEAIAGNRTASRTIRARALFEGGRCQEWLGDRSAGDTYRRILTDYPDQGAVVEQARRRLDRLLPPARPTLQQVAERTDIGMFGAVSPDGARVAYVSMDDRLCILEIAGDAVRCLTPRNTGGIRSMVFSRDGSRLAYGLGADPGKRSLYVTEVKDGQTRLILSPGGHHFLAPADWSGDGVLIALNDAVRKSTALAEVTPGGGEVRTLRNFSGDVPLPARYSPDRRFIVFHLGRDLHVMTANGAQSWPVMQLAGGDLLVGWAGDQIVFLSDRRGALDLWALPVRDGRAAGLARNLHRNLDRTRSLGVTSDGSYHFVSPAPETEVFVAELDGATGELVGQPSPADPTGAGIHSFADWSLDGETIAYWSLPATGTLALKLRSLKGGASRSVPVRLFQPGLIRWFPDGSAILTEAFDPVHGDRFHRVNVSDGSTEVAVPHDLSRDSSVNPAWLDSGNTLLFRARLGGYRTPGPGRLYTWSFENSALKEIGSPESFGSWALSPSRKQVAFLIHENGTDALRIGPLGGNEPRLLYRTPPGRFLAKSSAFAWTRDEEAVIATMGTYANPGASELWWFPVRAETPRRILSTGGVKDLRMHPDGVRFSFTADGFRQSIWAVRNALPIRAQPSRAR